MIFSVHATSNQFSHVNLRVARFESASGLFRPSVA